MKLTLVTGGVRSGKSRYAESLAASLGGSVTYIAAGRPADDEMKRRIARHRARRDPTWDTIEIDTGIDDAVRAASGEVVLLDCLTTLLANVFTAEASEGTPSENELLAACETRIDLLLDAAGRKAGTFIVVTNEVGMGVVPVSDVGRWFRDAQGLQNQRLAAAAERVVWMVSGIPVPVKGELP